jgi:hypothetical protein
MSSLKDVDGYSDKDNELLDILSWPEWKVYKHRHHEKVRKARAFIFGRLLHLTKGMREAQIDNFTDINFGLSMEELRALVLKEGNEVFEIESRIIEYCNNVENSSK